LIALKEVVISSGVTKTFIMVYMTAKLL